MLPHEGAEPYTLLSRIIVWLDVYTAISEKLLVGRSLLETRGWAKRRLGLWKIRARGL